MKLEDKGQILPVPVLSKYPQMVSEEIQNGAISFQLLIGIYTIEQSWMVQIFMWAKKN